MPVPAPRERPLVYAVDDDEEIADLYRIFLKSEGCEVRSYLDPAGLVERVKADLPDLVLLDVMLGEASGFDLCRALKADPATALVPVVLVTALDGRDDRVRGIDSGADEFLSKPIHKEELRARVRGLLRLHEMRKALEAERLDAETRKREALRRTFERYVSPRVVAQILQSGTLQMGSDRRVEAVALFADMRGFTRLAEQLPPPEVVKLLNRFFSLLTEIAFVHDGTVLNMAGDCLLVAFGVPLPHPRASLGALSAARAMVSQSEALAAEWKATHGIEVGIGIGINCGEVIAGNVGSPSYTSFTIIGDAVNVAARLMQSAAAGEVVVSQAVRERLGEDGEGPEWEGQEPLQLKGRGAPVLAYRLLPGRR